MTDSLKLIFDSIQSMLEKHWFEMLLVFMAFNNLFILAWMLKRLMYGYRRRSHTNEAEEEAEEGDLKDE